MPWYLKKNTLLIEHLICKPHFYWLAFKAANNITTKSKIGLRPTTVMLSTVQLHVVTMKKSDATIFFHVFFIIMLCLFEDRTFIKSDDTCALVLAVHFYLMLKITKLRRMF